jgi:phthalate 4,5-cis-dihydrodiol dehydrogenase
MTEMGSAGGEDWLLGGCAMFNVGVIGAGSYGAEHARAIAELEDVRLVASCRTNRAALDEFTAQYGGQGYTNYRDLLADRDVDIVVIATPHHVHTQVAEDTARAGKHILLEKPMAPTLAECDRILAAVERAGVRLMVGHVNHFAPAYAKAKEILDSGEMGQIVLGTSTMSKYWFEPNRRDWHLDRETGGGMWMTAGIHCLDRLTWLIGSPVTSVCAQLDTCFHDQQADDTGLIFLRYASGAVGAVVSVGYAEGAPKHLTELTCTRGMLNIDYMDGLTIGRGEKWQPVPDSGSQTWMHEALVNEWRAFIDALQADREPPVSGAYAREVMAVVFAAEQSSRERREIALADQQP